MQYAPGSTSIQAGTAILVLATLGLVAGYAFDKPALRRAGAAILPAGVHLTISGGVQMYRARNAYR